MNACAKCRCVPLRIKKTLGILDASELIPTRRRTATTTRVAFWDPLLRVQKRSCSLSTNCDARVSQTLSGSSIYKHIAELS